MSLYPRHGNSPEHPRIRGHELSYQQPTIQELAIDAAKRLIPAPRQFEASSVEVSFGGTTIKGVVGIDYAKDGSDRSGVVVVRR